MCRLRCEEQDTDDYQQGHDEYIADGENKDAPFAHFAMEGGRVRRHSDSAMSICGAFYFHITMIPKPEYA